MKKNLYLATNIEHLNKLVQKDFKNHKAAKLFKSAETLFQTGLGHLQDGDEERAYIFFVRFILIYDYLQKLKKDDGYTKKRLGSEYNTISEQLEKLKLSLIERYTDKQNVLDLPPPIFPQSTGDAKSTTIEYPRDYVSCNELYGLLQTKVDIVILDARSADDYRQSSMKDRCCVNIPEEIIKSGLSANVLGKDVTNESKFQWDRRWLSALTVLMDWSSTKETITASKLSVLKNILVEWDPTMNNSNPPVVLSGGYLEWLQTYPMHCTNPDFVHEVQNTVLNELLDLEIIEYPTTEINEPSKQLPIVDRATKPKIPVNGIKIKEEYESAITTLTKGKLPQSDQKPLVPELEFHESNDLNDQRMEDNKITDTNKQIEDDDIIILSTDSEEETEKPVQKLDDKKSATRTSDSVHRKKSAKHGSKLERLLIEAREKKKPIPKNRPAPTILRTHDLAKHIRRVVIPTSGKNLGPGLTGLVNINNTCYMSASVQCLSNTGRILNYFLNPKFVKDINTTDGTCGYVARAFGNMIQRLWSGTETSFTPKDMRSAVIQFAPKYNGNQHQDAHEFIITLTNWLHEDLRREMFRARQVVWTPKERSYIQQTEGKNSVILDTFCGQIRNTIVCEACLKVKEKYEIFENLTLALPSDRESCTLEDCIQAYFAKEPIIGYKCPQCSCETQIFQQSKMVSYPPVLVLQLKRFSERVTSRGVTYERNNTQVNYPLKYLNVFQRQYKLYATVNHRGSLEIGHYYSFCMNPITERWHEYDDSHVCEIDMDMAKNPTEVYMLFYQTVEEEMRAKHLFTLC